MAGLAFFPVSNPNAKLSQHCVCSFIFRGQRHESGVELFVRLFAKANKHVFQNLDLFHLAGVIDTNITFAEKLDMPFKMKTFA